MGSCNVHGRLVQEKGDEKRYCTRKGHYISRGQRIHSYVLGRKYTNGEVTKSKENKW